MKRSFYVTVGQNNWGEGHFIKEKGLLLLIIKEPKLN